MARTILNPSATAAEREMYQRYVRYFDPGGPE